MRKRIRIEARACKRSSRTVLKWFVVILSRRTDSSIMKQNFVRKSPAERAYPNFRYADTLESIREIPARLDRPLPPIPPPTAVVTAELVNGELRRTTLRRSRPLTRVQEVLFLSAAFAFGGVLQMFVILYMSGILE